MHIKKRYVTINVNDFEKLVEFKQIQLDKNQIDTEQGGAYIVIDDFGPILGGIIEDNYLKTFDKKETLNKLLKIVKYEIGDLLIKIKLF